MAEKQRLNLDLATAISSLHYSLKHFSIKTKRFKPFFRGKSFNFEGYREYTGEEDSSRIDWRASLRANKLLIKKYLEEEDIKILFVIDTGNQMISGSTQKLKCEYAAELAISLAYLIIKDDNKAGCLLFGDKINQFIIPKKGTNNFDLLIDVIANPDNYGGASDMASALDFISNRLDNSYSAVVLISDFTFMDKKLKNSLNFLSSRFETIAFIIKDPTDKALPALSGEFIISNPRTGEQILMEPKIAKNIYQMTVKNKESKIRSILKDSNIDYFELLTSENFVPGVTSFIENRAKRK